MKILFITHRIPYPPNKGDKIRAFNIIRHLSRKHSISLACLADDIDDLKYRAELKKFCYSVDSVYLNTFWAKIRSIVCLFSSLPLTLAYFYSRKLKRIVREKLRNEKFGLIFIYSSSMAQYVLDAGPVPKIMDFVDVDSDKWRQYADYKAFPKNIIYRIEEKRLRRYEKTIATSVNQSIVTSQAEAELFKSAIPGIHISPVPNGVDYEYYKPDYSSQKENSLIFMGQMDYFANVDGILYFYREILPLIREKIPSIKLYIVGGRPAKELIRLNNNGVVVTGYVRDARPYVRKSAVCVVPLRIARGVQNKILEAMAMGVPVVTTSEANKGINAKDKEEIFINDNPAGFAESVLDLMNNPELRATVAAKARRFVESKFNWEQNLQKLEEILSNV